MITIYLRWIFVSSIVLLTNGVPCPDQCICRSDNMNEFLSTRISYTIDCTNAKLDHNELVINGELWSTEDEIIVKDIDPGEMNQPYFLSIVLRNSSNLKSFDRETIKPKGFRYVIQSLSISSLSDRFVLEPKAFDGGLFNELLVLNLSSCCRKIPIECSRLFEPLQNLVSLDLSGSDMYKNCLDRSGSFSPSLTNLFLTNNDYDSTTFSHSSRLFDGVREIVVSLDLKYSRFDMGEQLDGNCIFDLFTKVNSLDLSFVEFRSVSTEIQVHLKHLLYCKKRNNLRNGEEVKFLYLRGLNIDQLPSWFSKETFPQLEKIDLSKNQFRSIDLTQWENLKEISLAFNPINFENIQFRPSFVYSSINLRGTSETESLNLTKILLDLSRLCGKFDFSDHLTVRSNEIERLKFQLDFYPNNRFSVSLGRNNLTKFDLTQIENSNDLNELDLSGNQLTVLDLTGKKELTQVQCSNQNLNRLIFDPNLKGLIDLNCSRNSLTKLEPNSLENYENLKSIDLSFNLIESIDELFRNFASRFLGSVFLKSNRIEKINSNTFARRFISLHSIDLSDNRINTIETEAFQSVNLRFIDLTGNPLKFVQEKFIFTAPLRLFYLVDRTEFLIDRCSDSNRNDSLISTYVNWFENNGTFMKNLAPHRAALIRLDKCLKRYIIPTKNKGKLSNKRKVLLFIVLPIVVIVSLYGLVQAHRKILLPFGKKFRRYRRLDQHVLIDNSDGNNQQQHEDDEIAMNLNDPPFNKIERV